MSSKPFLKLLGRLGVGILCLVVLLTTMALIYRAYRLPQIAEQTKINSNNGIETLEKVTLNNSEQWIYLRGHDKNNPVLLFLHGGPGATEMPLARVFGLELEKHFTVVHWDQRASGKSRRLPFNPQTLSTQTYVEDTLALVQLLRKRFDQDKLYLVGHSWGTVLGTLVVRDHPELFHAYVGMGQVVNIKQNEQLSLEFVRQQAKQEGNAEALDELSEMLPPYDQDPSQLRIQRRWLHYYGGGMRNLDYQQLASYYLLSPEYSLLDTVAMIRGMMLLSNDMWPQLSSIDFLTQAPVLDVPVYFFNGRFDYNTPFALTEKYFLKLQAPSKQIIWFENSAHMMNVSDPQYFQKILIEKVLPETYVH